MGNGYSRPQKFIREVTGVSSLKEAEALRARPFWLIVHESAAARMPKLIRALIAVAVRSCSGEINIRVAGSQAFRKRVAHLAKEEAEGFGCASRLSSREFAENEWAGSGIALGMSLAGMVGVDAGGLYAAINHLLPPRSAAPHSAAACLAAALGFAKYFAADVLSKRAAIAESWAFSLDSLSASLPSLEQIEPAVPSTDLGEIHLLGAGAIGSAFCFSVHLSDDSGNLEIVDRGSYDEPNEETTFFIGSRDVVRNPPKAQELARLAKREGLQILGHPTMELRADDQYLRHSCDTFVCAVDNPETRRVLDSANCQLLINAGLGGTSLDAGHVLATSHNSDARPLSEFYSERGGSENLREVNSPPAEITDECSRLAYKSVALAAPFMALAAGALLHAFCRLNGAQRRPDANYIKLDLLGRQSQLIRRLIYR